MGATRKLSHGLRSLASVSPRYEYRPGQVSANIECPTDHWEGGSANHSGQILALGTGRKAVPGPSRPCLAAPRTGAKGTRPRPRSPEQLRSRISEVKKALIYDTRRSGRKLPTQKAPLTAALARGLPVPSLSEAVPQGALKSEQREFGTGWSKAPCQSQVTLGEEWPSSDAQLPICKRDQSGTCLAPVLSGGDRAWPMADTQRGTTGQPRPHTGHPTATEHQGRSHVPRTDQGGEPCRFLGEREMPEKMGLCLTRSSFLT